MQEIAEGKNPGGGPLESAYRLLSRKVVAASLDESPTVSVLLSGDDAYRVGLRGFLRILPDTRRHDLHPYVANGFDISWSQVLFLDNLLPLLAFLIPWGILAFYLMTYREVANPG
jgi:hypothetical protein